MVTAARRMSAQLFAPSRSQTLYVKNSLHHATGTKASSYWEDGAGQGGEERRKLKSNKYLQGHLSSRLEKGCLESRKELGCGREFSFYTNYIWILTWSFILFYFLSVYYRNRNLSIISTVMQDNRVSDSDRKICSYDAHVSSNV